MENKVDPAGFHFHSNGRGLVANTAIVEESAYVGPNAHVGGNAHVVGNAHVGGNAYVVGNAHVVGDAYVVGNAHVYGGDWESSPLYVVGSRHQLTNCAPGMIAIGCHVRTFAEWECHYKQIGKAEGYTEDEIAEYGEYIKLFCKIGK